MVRWCRGRLSDTATRAGGGRSTTGAPTIVAAFAASLVSLALLVPGPGSPAWAAPAGRPIARLGGAPAYALVGANGRVFTFGGGGYRGDASQLALRAPVVGAAASGGGYWLVASDGGIFSFGDAAFYGSMGGRALNQPIVGMAATPDGGGYWLVASDGGIFSFGDAPYEGSAVTPLAPPAYPAALSPPLTPTVAIMVDPAGPQATHTGPPVVAFVGDSLGAQIGVYSSLGPLPFAPTSA